jgi:GR25 family glycosyltransferase involved in LPS biosynthesis
VLTRNKWSIDHKGTLGCFLSHAKTWETIAKSSYANSLVIEDDVILGDMVSLLSLDIPDASDLIFCNDRIAYPGVVGLRPTAPAIPFVIEQRRAFGSDGYLLSKAGAIRLLKMVEQDSFFAHVDMRLIAYSVTIEEAEEHASLGRLSANIAALRRTYSAEHHITAFSLYPPIVFHMHQASRRQKIDDHTN